MRHKHLSKLVAMTASASALVLLSIATASSPAANVHFCGQNLSPGSYCNSTLHNNVREITGDATGGVGGGYACVKAFDSSNNGIGIYQCSSSIADACYSYPTAYGRNYSDPTFNSVAHYFTAHLYTYPDSYSSC